MGVVWIGKGRTGWPKTRWADTFTRAAGGLCHEQPQTGTNGVDTHKNRKIATFLGTSRPVVKHSSSSWSYQDPVALTRLNRTIYLLCLLLIFFIYLLYPLHYATNRQVTDSIPDGVIGIFQWHNLSGRTMALGSTQPLTEMSTRCISWG